MAELWSVSWSVTVVTTVQMSDDLSCLETLIQSSNLPSIITVCSKA